MAGKITMDDIAAMAGVTKSTVSRYFNGGSVKASTKKRIQEIIEEYNYEPNAFARLKARESNVIGVVVPTLNSKITSRVVTSIGRFLREEGYETLIKDSDHCTELELKNLQRLITLKVDGIIFSAISITEEHRALIQSSPVPVVVLAQNYSQGTCVVYDDYGAGKTVGEYVGRRCRGPVGYIGVIETDEAVGIIRKQGVLDGFKSYSRAQVVCAAGDYSFESGIKMAGDLLDKGPLNAIICATDRLAFGAYKAIADRGLEAGRDVSVTGFGGYDESALLKPRLTTVHFDSYGLGYLGAETLLKKIKGEPVPKKQIVDFHLIEGESVSISQQKI